MTYLLYISAFLIPCAIVAYFIWRNRIEDGKIRDLILREQVESCKFIGQIEHGGRFRSVNLPSDLLMDAWRDALNHGARVCEHNGYTNKVEPKNWEIVCIPATDFAADGTPAIRYYTNDYADTPYNKVDEQGRNYILAAERVIDETQEKNPYRWIVVETDNANYAFNAAYNGFDHLINLYNNEPLYHATKFHDGRPETAHPVTPQPPDSTNGFVGKRYSLKTYNFGKGPLI